MRKEHFEIIGMTCSACASNIEKHVSKMSGVSDVSVNLLKNSMTISMEDSIEVQSVIDTIRKAGYDAKLKIKDRHTLLESKENGAEIVYGTMKKRMLLSIIFCYPFSIWEFMLYLSDTPFFR